jgi:hypothetical protein
MIQRAFDIGCTHCNDICIELNRTALNLFRFNQVLSTTCATSICNINSVVVSRLLLLLVALVVTLPQLLCVLLDQDQESF